MRREEFLGVIGGATAVARPLAARAQHPPMPVIGFMSVSTTPRIETEQLPAFRQGLADKAAACGLVRLVL